MGLREETKGQRTKDERQRTKDEFLSYPSPYYSEAEKRQFLPKAETIIFVELIFQIILA